MTKNVRQQFLTGLVIMFGFSQLSCKSNSLHRGSSPSDSTGVINEAGTAANGAAGGVAGTGSIGGTGTGAGAEQDICSIKENYKGFGGRTLDTLNQGSEDISDRMRLKPFGSYRSEYERILNMRPDDMGAIGSTFTAQADRWFTETESSAVTIVTLYAAHFDLSLKYLENLGSNPKIADAAIECQKFQEVAWETEPTAEQVATCANFITKNTSNAPNVRNRFAYGFAAVLTSAHFLAY